MTARATAGVPEQGSNPGLRGSKPAELSSAPRGPRSRAHLQVSQEAAGPGAPAGGCHSSGVAHEPICRFLPAAGDSCAGPRPGRKPGLCLSSQSCSEGHRKLWAPQGGAGGAPAPTLAASGLPRPPFLSGRADVARVYQARGCPDAMGLMRRMEAQEEGRARAPQLGDQRGTLGDPSVPPELWALGPCSGGDHTC